MKVGLFIPCYVDAFFPEVGIATLELLERCGLDVEYPLDQTCCGQPMANSGCHDDAAATEALFVKNFAGYDYIVGAFGQLRAPRARALTAIPQTAEVHEGRAATPTSSSSSCTTCSRCASSRGPSSRTRSACTTAARRCAALREAKTSEIDEPPFSKPMRPAVARSRASSSCTPERPDECCGFGGTFSVFEEPVSARMGYDKVNDHHQRRRRVHRLGRHVLRDAPEGLRRAARAAAQVHPHRAGAERSPRHEARRPRRGVVEVHRGEGPRRLPRQAAVGPAQEARPRERAHARNGRSCATLASAIKEHTLTHLADYLEEFERNAIAQRRARALGARRRRAQPDRPRHPRAHAARRTLVKSKSMLTDECEMRPFLENRGIEVDRDRPRRAHPAARRRAAEPHRRAGGAQAARRRRARSSPTRSAPTRRTATCTTSPRASASTRGRTSCKAEAGMTGANFAVAETGSLRRLHQRGQRRPRRQPAAAPHRLDRHREADPADRAPRRLRPACCRAARSARRSPRSPRTSARRAPGTEMHVVLVDNGRSERLGMDGLLVLAQVHPLRRLHEHLPGVPAQRRPQLRRDLLGADRRHHRPDLQPAQIQLAAVRLDAQRQLHQRLPGEDQHPRADLQVAPDHRRAAPAADGQEGGDARRRARCWRARGSTAPRSRPRPRASSTCRASSIYNPFNAWGRQREVPAAPAVDLPRSGT